jgi:hypothetical protein
MHDRATFGPFEVDVMSAAFKLALSTAANDSHGPLEVDGHSLRRRIAAGIVAAARDGVVDMEDLATEGLRALEQPRAASLSRR